jgi:HAD superfamily hydrolase (TIGR01509 family)
MFKAIIFDMDGVLVNSEPAHYNADTALFEKLGINISDKERELFLGVSAEWMWNYILRKYPVGLSKKEILELDVATRSKFLLEPNHPEVNPGLEALLMRINNAGLPLAVASSTVKSILEPLLRELNLLKYFNHFVAGDQVKHAKPAPDVFLLASEMLQIPPNLCLVIEDSPNGIKAAKSAGMNCIGYVPSEHSEALFQADYIIRHFDELDINLIQTIYNKFN